MGEKFKYYDFFNGESHNMKAFFTCLMMAIYEELGKWNED